jgi:hypothetical protein
VTTFKEVRDATADDLKAVIGYLSTAEKNIREGDTDALVNLLDKWSLWGQMLLIRHEARIDDYRAKQEAAAPMSPSQLETP